MKNLILIIILNLLGFSLTKICNEIRRQILRGHYRDVLSDKNGGMLITAREMVFFGIGEQRSPLKDRMYFSDQDFYIIGHPRCDRYQSMTFLMRQAYEINTIRIRFWDYDGRFHYIAVFISFDYSNIEEKIFEGSSSPASAVFTIKFQDRLVQKIRIYTLGNSVNQHMSVIKIQAFYEF